MQDKLVPAQRDIQRTLKSKKDRAEAVLNKKKKLMGKMRIIWKRLIKQQKKNLLTNSELLVGRTILTVRKFIWCRGDIIKIKDTGILNITEYEVRYGNEPDNIWSSSTLL